MLLHLIILPFRSPKSAHAYRSIWQAEGSPLQHYTRSLTEKLSRKYDPKTTIVRYAMRYQNPAIETVVDEMMAAGVSDLTVLPLFPQYSSAASGSAIEEVLRVLKSRWNIPALHVAPPFYDHPEFIRAFGQRTKSAMASKWDHIIFSYHGLPVRHCKKSDLAGGSYCDAKPDCCAVISKVNQYCYRAQCVATTNALVASLGLATGQWTIAFQSRLGRTPWIKPYTDLEIDRLAAEGKKDLIVVSPSFVSDCLETLEEIEIRAEEQFKKAGGNSLRLVPSLNADDDWVDALKVMIG
jgi:ferrochelatase